MFHLSMLQLQGCCTIFSYSMYSIGEGGAGGREHALLGRREEPSMREEWMEKINDVRSSVISFIF